MAITLVWDKMQRNLLWIRLHEQLTWEDFRDLMERGPGMVREHVGRVDLIVLAEVPPPRGNPFPMLSDALRNLRELEHVRVIAAVDPFLGSMMRSSLQMMVRVMLPLRAARFHFVSSTEEALARVNEDRQRDA